MNDSMFDFLLMVMYIGCGVYCIYSYLAQKKTGELLANKIFCPSNSDVKKCKQPQEYIAYMLPRVLILGVGLVVFGCLFALNYYLGGGSTLTALLLLTVPLAFLVWFAVAQRKAVKLYW